MKGWLVDDAIVPPDQPQWNRNLWRILLEEIPGLEFAGGAPYRELADMVEARPDRPDYIIRNGTYFRRLNIDVPTVAFFQDNAVNTLSILADQYQVAKHAAVSVFNSPFLRGEYQAVYESTAAAIIPAPVDFDVFKPMPHGGLRERWGIPPRSVCWVGADNIWKGYEHLEWLIKVCPGINFVVVRKDEGGDFGLPNVRTFTRVGHSDLAEIMNCCHAGMSTSVMESQHLGLLEMGACGLPLVTTELGAFFGRYPGIWGMSTSIRSEFPVALQMALSVEHERWKIREYWKRECFDVPSVVGSWKRCIEAITEKSLDAA